MWPEKVLRQFRTALANSKESDFHDTGFTVVPQYLKATLKDPAALQLISTRAEADDQIRRIIDLAESCPLDRLHAVSVLGTKLCFQYSLDSDVKNRTARIDRY
ncbi:hypothetical protein DFH94DRAFT_682240 [Russula ochroleuca]|uniref:Uncharacterized protein n=1 Tax=Russula ochroleuca TaxID=152965 RepID=A0A9P5MV37_9AGAM|nr:hypothetical protein DFH94DRAFT_682240 [Russula ochroleuca]